MSNLEITPTWIFTKLPQERLVELQELHNSMEFEVNNEPNKLSLKFWHDEICEIVKLHPELKDTVQLKEYNI